MISDCQRLHHDRRSREMANTAQIAGGRMSNDELKLEQIINQTTLKMSGGKFRWRGNQVIFDRYGSPPTSPQPPKADRSKPVFGKKTLGPAARAALGPQFRSCSELATLIEKPISTIKNYLIAGVWRGRDWQPAKTKYRLVNIDSLPKPMQDQDAANLPEGARAGSLVSNA